MCDTNDTDVLQVERPARVQNVSGLMSPKPAAAVKNDAFFCFACNAYKE